MTDEKSDIAELVKRLHQLHSIKKLRPGVHGQILGQESYTLVASGEFLECLIEAADALSSQPSDGRDKPAAYIFHTGLFWPDGLTKEQKFVAAPLYHAPAFRPSKQSSAAPDQMPEEIERVISAYADRVKEICLHHMEREDFSLEFRHAIKDALSLEKQREGKG